MTAVHHSGHGTKPGSVSPLERVRRVLGGGSHSRDSSADGSGSDSHHHNPLFSMSHHASHSLSRHAKFGLGGSAAATHGAGRGLPHSSYSCPADLLSHGGAHLHHQGRGNASHLGPLFGRSLATYPAGVAPPVLKILCDFLEEHGLETEGLFRVSASQKSVNRLKASLEAELMSLMASTSNTGQTSSTAVMSTPTMMSTSSISSAVANWRPSEDLLEVPRDVPPAAAIVKMFLRELPQPLIPKEMTQQFVDALGEESGSLSVTEEKETKISEEVVERLRALVIALPPENFVTLKFLTEFLSKVAAKSEKNFMNNKSLGMVFAPCLFSLGDAMEMMAISSAGPVGHSGSHHPHPGGPTSTVTASMVAAELIDLPLAKKLCAQTQEVVVALIGECERIFASVEERNALDITDEECEELFLKCRPPLAAKRGVATSPDDQETGGESESLSHLVESIDEVTVIEADPPETKPDPLTTSPIQEEEEEENISLVVIDEPTTSISAASVTLVDMDDIDSKRARERMEEMPAFYGSRPTLAQLRKSSSGSGGSGSDGGYHHRRHRHRQRHHSNHSSPSKRAKRQYGGAGSGCSSSASSEDNSSCSNLNQNDQENREPNVIPQLEIEEYVDDMKNESIGMVTTDDEINTGEPVTADVDIVVEPAEEETAAPVEHHDNNEDERRIWQGAMDLNDPPVVAQRAIQGLDEVMFSPRSSIIIPREEAVMMERAASNTTSDHEVRRGDVPAGLDNSVGFTRRRRRMAYEEDDDEDDYDDVEACSISGAAFRHHQRRMVVEAEQVVPTGEKTQAEVILGSRHQQRTARRVSPRRKNDPAHQAASVLRRRASKLKKRLAAEEENYTKAHDGVKPTKADKMIHPEMRNLVVQLRQCKAELKRLVEDPSPATAALILAANGVSTKTEFPKPPGIASPNTADLETMVTDIEEHLKCIREAASRPDKLEDMSPAEVSAEKLSLQRALVYLENKFGRPNGPEEKKIVWNLYDRYRNVKRVIVRLGMTKPTTNLIPIPEHVQMDFPKPDHTRGDSKNGKKTPELQRSGSSGSNSDVEARRKDHSSTQAFAAHQATMRTPASLMVGDSSDFELELASYHEGTVRDLERMQRSLIERRKELKREIRIFEVGFEDNNGRPPRSEEERAPLERTYRSYKEVKARMRLIEALIQKQENRNTGRQLNHASPTR